MSLLERGSQNGMIDGVVHVDSEVAMIEQNIWHVVHKVFNAGDGQTVHCRYFIGNKIACLYLVPKTKNIKYFMQAIVMFQPIEQSVTFII